MHLFRSTLDLRLGSICGRIRVRRSAIGLEGLKFGFVSGLGFKMLLQSLIAKHVRKHNSPRSGIDLFLGFDVCM